MTIKANWSYPTAIRFGEGRIAEIGEACAAAGIARPLLVTDRGLAGLPITTATLDHMEAAGLGRGIYSDVDPNPNEENLAGGIEVFKSGGHDGVIAFGGGSGLDLAKMVAFMAGQTRPVWDFEDIGDWWTRADADAIAPIVAVPTTSGTGSEVGRASVVTHPDTHEKKIIFHPRMLPGVVISDPELTVGLPAKVTAATGIDAYVHCFEAFCAPGFHPMADGIALEGMRLIQTALPRAYDDGKDIEARADMLAAASMGATAFQKGLGGVHAISHAVGATYDTHHGLTNGIVLPHMMRKNEAAIADRMPILARTLGLAKQDFSGVLDWTLQFRERLGIPDTLGEIGVPADRADYIGELAERDPSAGTNPQKLNAAEYADVFRASVG